MLAINKINKQALIEYEDFLFMYVEEEEAFDSEKIFYVDAIIINSSETRLFEPPEKALDATRVAAEFDLSHPAPRPPPPFPREPSGGVKTGEGESVT